MPVWRRQGQGAVGPGAVEVHGTGIDVDRGDGDSAPSVLVPAPVLRSKAPIVPPPMATPPPATLIVVTAVQLHDGAAHRARVEVEGADRAAADGDPAAAVTLMLATAAPRADGVRAAPVSRSRRRSCRR